MEESCEKSQSAGGKKKGENLLQEIKQEWKEEEKQIKVTYHQQF